MSKTNTGYHRSIYSSDRSLSEVRREVLNAARELDYPVEVRRKLEAAETATEMNNIMVDARRRYL